VQPIALTFRETSQTLRVAPLRVRVISKQTKMMENRVAKFGWRVWFIFRAVLFGEQGL
jgi:hypothetical protein